MPDERIVLRYFAVRGRAQALRHALLDGGVAFDDVRVPLSEWPERRADPAFSGAYRALPTLTWGGSTLSETLPIASFIAKRLGHDDGLGAEEVAHRDALCSCSYIDVLLRLADVIRADVAFPGADCGRALAAAAPRLLQKLQLLEGQLPATGWIGGTRPVVADFCLAEVFDILSYVLGPARDEALFARLPRLAALSRAVGQRPRVLGAVPDRPVRFTARPDEDRIIEQLRAVDLSAASL